MASIKGFSLKKVTRGIGREGYSISADMYYGKVMVGSYSDYGDGGMADVRFNSKEAEKCVISAMIEWGETIVPKKNDLEQFSLNLYKRNPEKLGADINTFVKKYPYIKKERLTDIVMSYADDVSLFVEAVLNLMEDEKQYKRYIKKGYEGLATADDGRTVKYYMLPLSTTFKYPEFTRVYKCKEDFDL